MNGYNSNLHTPIVLIIVVVTLVVSTITYNAKAVQFEIDKSQLKKHRNLEALLVI